MSSGKLKLWRFQFFWFIKFYFYFFISLIISLMYIVNNVYFSLCLFVRTDAPDQPLLNDKDMTEV